MDAYNKLKWNLRDAEHNEQIATHKLRKLNSKFNIVLEVLKNVDQYLSERIIDPCGYNPAKESFEDLVTMITQLSNENETKLNEIRTILMKLEDNK